MKLETLTCNNCGGPLSVPDSANFVTCGHCGTQLAIRRTSSTTFTEQLGEIRSNQTEMMKQLAELERQNRLAQIDREWELERERYLITHKSGRQTEPSAMGSLIMGIIAAGFGIFWTVNAFSIAGGTFFPLFGLVFIAFGVWGAIYGYQKAKDFHSARSRYRRRRVEAVKAGTPGANPIAAGEPIPTPEEHLARLGEHEQA